MKMRIKLVIMKWGRLRRMKAVQKSHL